MIALPRVAPGDRLIGFAWQIWAMLRAEIAMQWRRWGLWVTFACVSGLLILLTVQSAVFLHQLPPTSLYVRQHYTAEDLDNLMTSATGMYGAMFFGVVAALLVVDRLGRDQRLGMTELQRATPQGPASYILGKFLGNYIAMLVPTLLAYLLCALISVLLGWSPALFSKFLLAFLLVFVPASLATVGLALLLASFLPVRVVQVVFFLLWFEFNIGAGWHGLVFTIFNPSGLYVYPVFFPMPPQQYAEPNFHTSMHLAQLNIAVLLLTAIVAVVLTYISLAFQQWRKEEA